MDIVAHNRNAWNQQSIKGSPWCRPVTTAEIAAARAGSWQVILTPNRSVPREWFGGIVGKAVLCLASGGGQQAPVLAAAGALVTSFDNSDEQLAKDRLVAERDALTLATVQGDMADLSAFPDETFDVIFHPVSNVFAEDVKPVWRECSRVLKSGGRLIAGFMNPLFFLFDHDEVEQTQRFEARYALPFSDIKSLSKQKREKRAAEQAAFEFGHTLNDQIGGQIAAGFVITGFYEDDWNEEATPLNKLGSLFIATLARKMVIP